MNLKTGQIIKVPKVKHKKMFMAKDSGQGGGVGRYTLPRRTTKTRTMTNLKTKKQPELPENQTVWKSNNQEVKEETFIQISRRGTGDAGGPGRRCG